MASLEPLSPGRRPVFLAESSGTVARTYNAVQFNVVEFMCRPCRGTGPMPSHIPHRAHVKLLLPAILIGLVSTFAFVAFFPSALHDPQPNDLPVAVVGRRAAAPKVQG